jgi:guanyl-specific ribonuclease Sa
MFRGIGAGVARGVRGLFVAKTTANAVPQHAAEVLAHVRANGSAPAGFKGGRTFMNDGRGGGQVLPKADAAGNPITYREWDVKAYQKGVNRGAERVVTGSDGKAYYTNDHYGTFNPFD